MGRTFSTRSSCPGLHLTWPWTPAVLEHPQLLFWIKHYMGDFFLYLLINNFIGFLGNQNNLFAIYASFLRNKYTPPEGGLVMLMKQRPLASNWKENVVTTPGDAASSSERASCFQTMSVIFISYLTERVVQRTAT